MRYVRPILGVLRWEGVLLVGALGLAIISDLATRWFLGFIFLAAVLVGLAWARAGAEDERARRFGERAERVGIWVWGSLLVLMGAAIFWRFSTLWGSVVFAIAYLVVGAFHLRSLHRGTSPMISQFRLVIALSVAPVLTAWILNSVLYLGWAEVAGAPGRSSQQAQVRMERLATRVRAADSWERGGGVRIAVTLSGGGYRAAVVHAGLLSALDRAGLPVHYLSTVSGGSITGATYALGWSPSEFRDYLGRTRPGLPNDMANFFPMFWQLLNPFYGTGDIYAKHFDRVYFRGAGMEDTGPPVLILNATRYRDGTREAFWPGRSSTGLIAREVAASAAFPVAFDPVRIGELDYMDGGVVDNLGVVGLKDYLEAGDGPENSRPVPGVLIISDVGIIPELPKRRNKPSVPEMAIHTQQASYFAMHQWIYRLYSGGRYDPTGASELDQPYEVEAGLLWPDLPLSELERTVQVFVLSPTSPAERARFEGQTALIEAVSSFQTLKELSPEEVDAAFWVGVRLAEFYLPLICAAAGGPECEEVDPTPAPPVP